MRRPSHALGNISTGRSRHQEGKIPFDVYHFHGGRLPSGPGPPRYHSFTNTLRHITLGRTPLDESSATSPCRDLYLTTHNTHNRQTSMPQAGFEPAIPTCERSQTHAVDSATNGVGSFYIHYNIRLMMTFRLKCVAIYSNRHFL
jgi:hypothetical protein